MEHIISKDILTKVPLNYNNPSGKQIDLFAREVFSPKNKDADIFVFLQGGPGFQAPRNYNDLPWAKELLKDFRLLLVDFRGTGKSQKVGIELYEKITQADQLAEYLAQHRADNIVRDLEYLREHHLKVAKWFLFGQSYGGFIICTYLSMLQDTVKGALITSGVPPIVTKSVDEVYEKLVARLCVKNEVYYKKYPQDSSHINKIVKLLDDKHIPLGSNGGYMSAQRFRDIGIVLGHEQGMETLHTALDDPFVDSTESQISWQFANYMASYLHYEANPIYAVLHESIYCNGYASNWSADRVLQSRDEFNLTHDPIYFYGETIRRQMFSEYSCLRGFQQAADILAEKTWPELYNEDMLMNNKVPIECLVNKSDDHVDYDYSMQTLDMIANSHSWEHPEWQHNVIKGSNGGNIIRKLVSNLMKRVN